MGNHNNNNNNDAITHDDILTAINKFADNVEGKFEKIDERFEGLEGEVTKIRATMVTKDYLDDKLSDLRGDLVVLTRKEDKKLVSLVEILEKKNILSRDDAKFIFSLEPFAQIQTV